MTNIRNKFLTATFLLALGGAQAASAATVTTSLGNTAPGFNDGDTPTIIQLIGAQGGQPAPFNAGIGNELLGPDFSASWTFNYAPIAFPDIITGATLMFGIADHDSSASGSQVVSFDIEGLDLTLALDSEFEANGGSDDGEYNVYALSLDSSVFSALADGSALVNLALAGPGLQTSLLGGDVTETPGNGAHLIYSTLSIQTQVVPIPAAAPLFASALVLMGLYRRRIQRREV